MKIAFTPAIYEHAARFAGRTPWEVSRDPELLFEGHRGAWLEYRHTPVCVGIDIYNLEAEAYGAVILRPTGEGIPAIQEPLCADLDQALAVRPFDPTVAGRIPLVLAVGRRLHKELPDADIRIPVAGPFSIAFNLCGINNLCEYAATRPQEVARLLMHLADHQAAFCRAVAAAGLDIAFFESAAAPPMLSPAQFHELELPALRRILALAADCIGHPVPCIMGGHTVLVVDDLLATGTRYLVCNVETDQAAFLRRVAQTHPHVRVRVNMDPAIVAGQDLQRIHREVDRVLALSALHSNCVMGTGALPYETPPENIHLIQQYIA